MKRWLAGATLGVAGLLAFPVLASAGNDVARGNGTSLSFPREFNFNAQSNFNGSGASGSVSFTNPDSDPDTTFKGRVTCLQVIGNTAQMSGDIIDISGGQAQFFSTTRSFILRAIDSGRFATTPDQVGYFVSSALPPPPPTCVVFSPFTSPIFDGEIVIKDATS
jgi:hypothetical protein